MTNTRGDFIWYELLSSDPEAASAFYSAVVGWTARDSGHSDMKYGIFSAGDGDVGGFMALPHGAVEAGMKPVWLGYIGVDDVDVKVSKITAAGGHIRMPATDISNVGRIAMVADPQGANFYVMRGISDQTSTAFSPTQVGHCSWNELSTSDPAAALSFYTRHFGWTKGDAMPMGPEMGDYQFINNAAGMLGAIMKNQAGGPSNLWRFYFRVADIDDAAKKTSSNGGTILFGPEQVPGGEFIIIGNDPQGAMFGLVGARHS